MGLCNSLPSNTKTPKKTIKSIFNRGNNSNSSSNETDYNSSTYDPAHLSSMDDSELMSGFTFPSSRLTLKSNSHSSKKNSPHYLIQPKNIVLNMSPIPNINDDIPVKKRVIFISVTQLNLCIDIIPDNILLASIFCFKADRCWFFPSSPRECRISKLSIAGHMNYNPKFLYYVQEKDAQGLILWLSDDKTWKDISDELEKIPDIYYSNINSNRNGDRNDGRNTCNAPFYKPLKLDISWWLHNYVKEIECRTAFSADADAVVGEILSGKGKYLPTMELLFQSNTTLIPMRVFNMDNYLLFSEDRMKNNCTNTELKALPKSDLTPTPMFMAEMVKNTTKLVPMPISVAEVEMNVENPGTMSSLRTINNHMHNVQHLQLPQTYSHHTRNLRESSEFEMIEEPMDYRCSASGEFSNEFHDMFIGVGMNSMEISSSVGGVDRSFTGTSSGRYSKQSFNIRYSHSEQPCPSLEEGTEDENDAENGDSENNEQQSTVELH